jgi:hypothetical protein
MLDSFIIEELKRREERERDRARQERPRLDIPADDRIPQREPPRRDRDADGDEEPQRGVIVIDL